MTRIRASIVILLLASVIPAASPSVAQAQTPTRVQTAGGEVSVMANRFEQAGSDNLLVAIGEVEVTRGTSRLLADRVEINRETGDIVALGRVIFYDGDNRLTGQRIDFNIKIGTGVVYEGEAHAAPYYRLMGERLERLGENVYRVQRGVFTTCEDEVPSWSFHLGSMTADLEDYVYGTNASFWVKSVPVIPYFPFFAAPIRRERQSGFLAPQLGNSSRKGFFAEIPFYWAISDSQDATLTAGTYSKRGFGAAAEYRYILSQEQHGRLNGAIVQEVFKSDDTRGFGSVKHDWQIAPGLSLLADLNAVSDDQVLRDYETELRLRSAQRAESNLFLTRTWTNWNFVGRIYWYQDLTTTRPVELQRVPELRLEGVRQPLPGLPGFLYQVDTSAVNFLRYAGSEGARGDFHPLLSRPIPLAGYATVTPFVGGRVTGYSTTVTGTHTPLKGGQPIEDTNGEPRVRELLEFGSDVDSRTSRVYSLGGWGGLDRLLHAIEPRVHYIRIVGHNFYSLPDWTSQIDQIPEANWFEFSVANLLRGKTISPDDTEAARLDLARLVVASAYDFQKGRFGNLAGDLTVQPGKSLTLHADASYDVQGDNGLQATTTDVTLSIPPVTGNVGYRFNRFPAVTIPYFVQIPGTFNRGNNVPEAQSISFLQGGTSVEVLRNLALRARTNWDIRSETFVENRFGADFKFDCWAISLEYVRRGREAGQPADNEFRFSVNLLGLGHVLSSRMGGGALDSAPGLK
ncbi:MAG TPA: LPS assembly protein LptD [Candidatus Binatia bacterium]|nr:LPS assembly protein LptD [Candidatus Binatia bacterium]